MAHLGASGCRFHRYTEGLRKSQPYQEWQRLLHHFYDPLPTVEHYEALG